MEISLSEKKAEAIKRMKILGIFPDAIEQFEKDDLVSISEPPYGALYWLDKKTKRQVARFEKKFSALVYIVIRTYSKDFGTMDSYLFVSNYKEEEWQMDIDDLEQGKALAYVYNHDEPMFSEFGSIGIEKTFADWGDEEKCREQNLR